MHVSQGLPTLRVGGVKGQAEGVGSAPVMTRMPFGCCHGQRNLDRHPGASSSSGPSDDGPVEEDPVGLLSLPTPILRLCQDEIESGT